MRLFSKDVSPVKPNERVIDMNKLCMECKDKPARYWGSSFCEDCFRELLRENLEKEDEGIEHKKDV